jgi:hypothetical protein
MCGLFVVMDEFEWEEIADMAVEDLRAFVNTEEKLVEEEHELIDKLFAWDSIMAHIEERLPADSELHSFNLAIAEKLVEIRDLLESGPLHNLKIRKEEQHLLASLEADLKHRDWRAVKKDIAEEEAEEEKVIRLEAAELKILHTKFTELLALADVELSHLKKHLPRESQKDDFEQKEEHYYLQIYKFARAYEEIFRHLLEKEEILLRKLKNKNP